MAEENLPTRAGMSGQDKRFEQLKSVNLDGAPVETQDFAFLRARDLQPLLGYNHWRSFEKAVAKAITSCQQSGNDPDHHFAHARKMIALGRGGLRDADRVGIRKQTTEEVKALPDAARQAGVRSRMFGVFHDAGVETQNLASLPYGGLGSDQIKTRKRISPGENLLDRMGTTELAANQFRRTQTREKLNREGIQGQQQAIETHHQVGKEVREAIRQIGGTMPETLPPAEPIQQVQKRLKDSSPHVELNEPDAKGLAAQKQKGTSLENTQDDQPPAHISA